MILEIFNQYWPVIVTGCLSLINILCCLLRSRVKVVDNVKTVILSKLPAIINLVEKQIGDGKGDKKLLVVTNIMLDYLKSEFKMTTEEASEYIPEIKDGIESILSTPEKKGD